MRNDLDIFLRKFKTNFYIRLRKGIVLNPKSWPRAFGEIRPPPHTGRNTERGYCGVLIVQQSILLPWRHNATRCLSLRPINQLHPLVGKIHAALDHSQFASLIVLEISLNVFVFVTYKRKKLLKQIQSLKIRCITVCPNRVAVDEVEMAEQGGAQPKTWTPETGQVS